MKNDINIIKNELIEKYNIEKEKEQEKQEKKKIQELKEICKYLVYTSINDTLKNNISIEDIYLQKYNIIKIILNDIKNQTILIEDTNSFEDKQIEVLKYNYPDYYIINIINDNFEVEYNKIKKQIKEKNNILKNKMYNILYEDLYKQIINQNNIKYLLEVLDSEDYRIEVAKCYSKNQKIIYEIYFEVIKELKKNLKSTIKIEEVKNAKKEKYNIFFKWNIFKKALKTYWKM